MNKPRTLVLNADFSPISLLSWQSVMNLDYKNRINIVDYYQDHHILLPHNEKMPLPAVVSLKKQKKRSKKIPFSRKNIFIRDNMTCQYCKNVYKYTDLTIDHVIPRSKWKSRSTPTCWENIVTCCNSCNHIKADKDLEKCGLSIKKMPSKPNPHIFVLGLSPWNSIKKEWMPYLPKLYLEICTAEEE